MIDKRLTFRFKSIINNRNISTEELARKANIPYKRLEKLLNNEESYTIEDLTKLSMALQFNLSAILIHANTNCIFTIDVLRDKDMLMHIENNDINYIVNCFLLNRIVKFNNDLYYVTYMNGISSIIKDEVIDKIFDLLMKNGYEHIAKTYMIEKFSNVNN